MDTCDRIFDLLHKSGMEQKEFAEKIGALPAVVSAWKVGKSKSYTKYLPQITDALNTSVEYLMTGKEKESTVPEDDELINTITFSRNGKIVKKQYSPEKWKTIIEMLDAIPEDKLP